MRAQKIPRGHELAHPALTHSPLSTVIARRTTHAGDVRAGLVRERQILHRNSARQGH